MPRKFKEDVILELAREENAQGEPTILRVVRWNEGAPKLEKRMFWRDDQGELKAGKSLGLTAEDFQLILEKKGEIQTALS